jgi:hypothetical protein
MDYFCAIIMPLSNPDLTSINWIYPTWELICSCCAESCRIADWKALFDPLRILVPWSKYSDEFPRLVSGITSCISMYFLYTVLIDCYSAEISPISRQHIVAINTFRITSCWWTAARAWTARAGGREAWTWFWWRGAGGRTWGGWKCWIAWAWTA